MGIEPKIMFILLITGKILIFSSTLVFIVLIINFNLYF